MAVTAQVFAAGRRWWQAAGIYSMRGRNAETGIQKRIHKKITQVRIHPESPRQATAKRQQTAARHPAGSAAASAGRTAEAAIWRRGMAGGRRNPALHPGGGRNASTAEPGRKRHLAARQVPRICGSRHAAENLQQVAGGTAGTGRQAGRDSNGRKRQNPGAACKRQPQNERHPGRQAGNGNERRQAGRAGAVSNLKPAASRCRHPGSNPAGWHPQNRRQQAGGRQRQTNGMVQNARTGNSRQVIGAYAERQADQKGRTAAAHSRIARQNGGRRQAGSGATAGR